MFKSRFKLVAFAALAGLALLGAGWVEPAGAAPSKCFGKKINRFVKGNGKQVKLAFRDVAWVTGNNVTVIGKPYSTICAGKGRQVVYAGKGRSRTDAGPGNDKIVLHRSSNLNIARGGIGNDELIGSNGHDFLYGGPIGIKRGVRDRDVIRGRGGNDRIYVYGGIGNRLYGESGSDRIFSLGNAVSEIHGGNGTDFLYSNGGVTGKGIMEKIFGERGNDRLYADRKPNNGPAFLDGGSGDDWIRGTPRNDIILLPAGIKKIDAGAGDDLIVATSRGRATVNGGPGRDEISFATHTPPGYRGSSGVRVDLGAGRSWGASQYALSGIEDVAGSPFDDEIIGSRGTDNRIDGGLGDDALGGQSADEDRGDGGLGVNECSGFRVDERCNQDSPGDLSNRQIAVDINEGGVLTVLGSRGSDRIAISYERLTGTYRVATGSPAVPSGRCRSLPAGGSVISCPANVNNLNGIIAYGNSGNDSITVANSVPSGVTATINGGSGRNTLTGGRTKDVISTEGNSAGSVINGRGNLDLLYLKDAVTIKGGEGNDVLHIANPCVGGRVSGGIDKDNVVFAGAPRGVRADLGKGFARWTSGGCAKPVRLGRDIEGLEGSRGNDVLILGPRRKSQQGRGTLLGREGFDVLDSRNGASDVVTTGSGGRRNKVTADRKDRVVWGWGLSGY
jgi:Ca2+-binding RTX toxin-like protein